MPNSLYLAHHGILGMHWGIRRTPEQLGYTKRDEKKDLRWVKKHDKKIYDKTYSKIKGQANNYLYGELAEKYKGNVYTSKGKLNGSLVSDYNKRLAQLMNEAVGDIPAPSGKVIRYVAKRGSVGVYTALADSGYNMNQVKNGVWGSGRIAYKKSSVNTVRQPYKR